MSEEAYTGVSNGRILIVDDSIFIATQLTRILSSAGYEVVGTASDGQAGVELYQKIQNDVDLVTLDITMPRMDGITALQKILEINKNANVIMVSAVSKEDLVKKALLSGAKNYIVKPLNHEAVIDRVAQVLGKK